MIEPINERACVRCRAAIVSAHPLCGPCRAARDRWLAAEAEIRRLEEQTRPGRPLRIIDMRSRSAA